MMTLGLPEHLLSFGRTIHRDITGPTAEQIAERVEEPSVETAAAAVEEEEQEEEEQASGLTQMPELLLDC